MVVGDKPRCVASLLRFIGWCFFAAGFVALLSGFAPLPAVEALFFTARGFFRSSGSCIDFPNGAVFIARDRKRLVVKPFIPAQLL
jgi:hypothetical protein